MYLMVSTKKIDRQILQELRMIKKATREANTEINLEKNKPHQTKNSPYLTDRKFFELSAVKNSAQETSWKEVKSYEENREKWIDHDSDSMSQGEFEDLISKKINII